MEDIDINNPLPLTKKIDGHSLIELELLSSLPCTGTDLPMFSKFPIFDNECDDEEKVYTWKEEVAKQEKGGMPKKGVGKKTLAAIEEARKCFNKRPDDY